LQRLFDIDLTRASCRYRSILLRGCCGVAIKSISILCAIIVTTSTAALAEDTRPSRTETFQVDVYLCETPEYAIKFTVVAARVEKEEDANATVDQAFNGEVCKKYSGLASVEKRVRAVEDGLTYQLTAFRLADNNKIAWMAEPDVSTQP
jgi:hypothetical protein